MNLEQFNPTVAELTKLAAEARQLTVTDYGDVTQIKAVHERRMILRDARVDITKKAKLFREEAVTFQKRVIEKEKELVGIIEPEEHRLQCIEDEAKAYAIRQERERKWPERLERLAQLQEKGAFAGGINTSDVKMMDDVSFENLIGEGERFIEAQALAKQRADQLAREADLKRREDELEAKERASKAEEEAKARAEREKADAEAREKRRAEELEAARIEGEKKAKADAERIEKEKRDEDAKAEKRRKIKMWLEERGYNEQTKCDFYIEHTENAIMLYKLVDFYRK